MAITNMDALVKALASGEHRHVNKAAMTAKAIGLIQSTVTATGNPAPGVVTLAGATNGVIPTQTLAGAGLRFTNPTGTNTLYLAQLTSMIPANAAVVSLYDRLFHAGSFNATTTSITITSPPALTRPDANGTGTEMWVEIATATTSAGTITITYTNAAGTGSRTGTAAIPAATVLGQMVKVNLAAGDTGVKSIQSYTLSGSLAAGTLNLLILRRIVYVINPNTSMLGTSNAMTLSMPIIYADAYVMFVHTTSGSSSGTFVASMTLVQG